ncbi:NB-ARC domain-containing protein [Microcoleus sp. N3A4]|uniref:NB-ARC domain-containing protein n=1 Tax=Microcoleus sp. N3A4 TaxID=3055379 RepID=UPI002FD7908D
MADKLKASEQGLKIVDEARRKKRWQKISLTWVQAAATSEATLKRFWARKSAIDGFTFIAICKSVGVNWEEVAELSQIQKIELPVVSVATTTPSLEDQINVLPLQPTDGYSKNQRGVWIPNLRCRKVWGRESFSEEVLHRLNDPQEAPILSLCGSAGYGKTEVACKVAMAAVRNNLFADVLWVKARDTEFLDGKISQSERDEALSWNQLLQEIAHQLDGCSVKRVHQRIKEEKRLIVLDNAETAQLEDILPKLNEMLNPSRVLLTSRFQTNACYVGLINIPPLEEHCSYQLLQDEAKYKNVPALLQADTAQLQQVYHLSCGAPLALHFMVGRVLDDGTLKPVLSALEQASGDVEKIYEFSLKTAWQRISDATKNVLRYMGDSDAGVTWEELSGARQVQESDWSIARRELRRWYLIEDETDAQGKPRYNLHPWVRRSLRGGLVDKWQLSLQEWEQIAKWKYDID